MFKQITQVVPGDVILDGGGRMKVVKVEHGVCMHKIHINGNACYERFAEVRVAGSPQNDRDEELVAVGHDQ